MNDFRTNFRPHAIFDWIEGLEKISSMLGKLSKLCPVEEYEDD